MATFGAQLRELRTARGLSLSALADQLHYSKGYLSNLERGNKRPNEDLARLCDDALGARGDLIAAAHLDAMASRDATPWQTAELISRIQASDTTPGTLDMLAATVNELCCEYPYRDAADLRSEAHGWLNHVGRLLKKPVGLREHTELLVNAGWLALLIGCLEYDMGMRAAAESTRAAAKQIGDEAGHAEITGWSWEMAAWFALTQGRYRDVLAASDAGRVTDRGHSVHVQLIAQEAKARARLGDVEGLTADLELGREILASLPRPQRTDHHFVVDPDKWAFYAMDAYRLSGDEPHAREYAGIVLDTCITPDGIERAPMRVAEARLTLATIASRDGDLDAAVDMGLKGINGHRRRSLPSLLLVAGELDSELQKRYPHEGPTNEYREALRALHRPD
ncbi:MAG: helix-turn-helix domain-containing protein [Streptosporangiales bacterium]|nr:helix-turn-helix domain-containing protein [Streptosporangiales bacterium]